jgi:hypothetical protein
MSEKSRRMSYKSLQDFDRDMAHLADAEDEKTEVRG